MKYTAVLVLAFLLLLCVCAAPTQAQAVDFDTCLCFTAEKAGSTVAMHFPSAFETHFQYSRDGINSSPYDASEQAIILQNVDDKVWFYSTEADLTEMRRAGYYVQFDMTGQIAASGSVMSLNNNVTDQPFTCERMFLECTALTSAPELPSTSIYYQCYEYMFEGCTGLTKAPALPAKTLAWGCYGYMFSGCTGLTEAPVLPAAALTENCYSHMFSGCTGLKKAPALSATKLAWGCCSYMFSGCTGLTEAPALPAMKMEVCCYEYMFSGCTGLKKAPALPATTLDSACYQFMFSDCTGLTDAPALPAARLAPYCYNYMFKGCTGLTGAPALPATMLDWACYQSMFSGCTALKRAPELPAPAAGLALFCYNEMFSGCAALEVPPSSLPEEPHSISYQGMFKGCTSLQVTDTEPDEPEHYFTNRSLDSITDMFATGSALIQDPNASKDHEYYMPSGITVTFAVEGGTAPDAVKFLKAGDKVPKPADPAAAGCTFDGWYTDAVYETPWNFAGDTVTESMTLYGWMVDSSKTFNVNYQFVSDPAEKSLPLGIEGRLPDSSQAANNTGVTPAAPRSVEDIPDGNGEGTWIWIGWDKDQKRVTGADVTFTGTWTFVPKTLTSDDFTVAYVTEEYNKAPHGVTVVMTNPHYPLTGITVQYTRDSVTEDHPVDAGLYHVTVVAGGPYYSSISFRLGQRLRITSKEFTVTPVRKTKAYGMDDPTPEWTFTGLLPGDSTRIDCKRVEGEAPGDYKADKSTLSSDNPNYKATLDTEAVMLTITDPVYTRGQGGTYILGSNADLVFRVTGPLDKFFCLQVDGVERDRDVDYTATSGSTILALKSAYLETLREGRHILNTVYLETDPMMETQVETYFFVGRAVPPPQTGDRATPLLWALLLLGTGVILAILPKNKR